MAERAGLWQGRRVEGRTAGWNPLVAGDMLKAYRKFALGPGDAVLTRDSHWRLGGALTASPTCARPAVLIGFSPLLVLASGGCLLQGVLPAGTSLMALLGWHLENPDFSGLKVWVALFWDWDWPSDR